MPTLRYFYSRLKGLKKLPILGVALLSISIFAFKDIGHMLLVDISSDTPPETAASVPAAEPVTTAPVDTNIVATDPAAITPVAEGTITPSPEGAVTTPAEVPIEIKIIPVDAMPSAPIVIIPDCIPEVIPPPVVPAVLVAPVENVIPVVPTVETSVEVATPAEASPTTAPVEKITVPTIPTCAPKQSIVPEPPQEIPVKKVEQNIPFVDLDVPKPIIEKEVAIDSTAPQSCNAESFNIEIQSGHSQVIPLLLQGSNNADNSVKIGDVPKGTFLTFVSNGLTEITGINFDNLMISADVAPDAQKGSFNVPIIL